MLVYKKPCEPNVNGFVLAMLVSGCLSHFLMRFLVEYGLITATKRWSINEVILKGKVRARVMSSSLHDQTYTGCMKNHDKWWRGGGGCRILQSRWSFYF